MQSNKGKTKYHLNNVNCLDVLIVPMKPTTMDVKLAIALESKVS